VPRKPVIGVPFAALVRCYLELLEKAMQKNGEQSGSLQTPHSQSFQPLSAKLSVRREL